MKDKMAKISLLYRIIIVLISGYGLYINFRLVSFRYGILYFTNISNLLCFLFFLWVVLKTLLGKEIKNNRYYIIKGIVTMAIALTMFIYNLCLTFDNTITIFIGHDLESNIVHVIVPLLVVFDYFIFEEKGHLQRYYPVVWSIILLAYILFAYIYAGLGGGFIDGAKYPYPFMDISNDGVLGVIVNIFIILVLYIGFGSIIQFIDDKLSKKNKKNT